MKPEDYYKRHAKLGNVEGALKNHVGKNKEAILGVKKKCYLKCYLKLEQNLCWKE